MTKTNKKVTRIDKPIKNITRIIKLPNKGDSGYTPVKGKDYFDGETPSDEKLLSLITPRIPKPIKGENGKDGKSFTKKEVRDLIDESLAEKMPELMADLEGRGTVSVEELNKGFNLVIKGKKYYIGGDVVGPKLRLLVQMGDLDLPNGLVGQAGKIIKVKTNETGFELGTASGGSSVSVNGVEVTDPNFEDTAEIAVTATGSDVNFALKNGSIDETKLDTSVNASLDLADSALQAAAIGVSVQAYSSVLANTTASFTTADETKLDNITVTQAVNLDTMESDIAALANGMVYKGNWDASAGTFPGAGAAQTGWFYTVSVGGTVDSVVFVADDRLVATTDNASATVYAGNWTKLDATDAVISIFGRTGNVVATSGDYTTAIVADSADKRYVTDAQLTVIGNTSGTNSGNQTITNSSDATSHTVTLSASGGSVQLIEGTGITLTTGGTGSAGTVTIAASGGSGDVTKVGTPVDNQVGVWTGDGTIEGDVDLTFDTSTNTLGVGLVGLDGRVQVHAVKSDASDGLLIEAANGTDVGLLGVGNTANATWNGSHNFEGGQVAVGKSATTLGKLKLYGNTSGDVTIQPNDVAGTGVVLTAPATTGTLALTSDIPVAGANTALSNLASVAINTSLVSDTDNTDDLGTTLKKWANLFVTTIGATATRVTKGWFTDIESTNIPTVGGTAILSSLTAPQFTTIELGHASDTTLSRVSAGVVAVEGKTLANLTDGGTFAADISVPDEAYGAGWNGSVEVPTKNAVYDKIQTIAAPTCTSITPYGANNRGAVVTKQMNSNTTGYAGAVVLPFGITVNKLSIENTATAASGTFDIGVYSQDGQTKYIDITTASIAGAQITTTAVSSVTLAAGVYYVVVVPNSSADSTFNVWQSLPNNGMDGISSEPITAGTLTVTAGTLPTTFNPVTDISANSGHGIVVRLDN